MEPMPVEERDIIGTRHFADLPVDLLNEIGRLRVSGSGWERMIASHYLGHEEASVMFSTLEKTILLKSTALFREIPAEKLSRVAAIAEETRCPAGSRILSEGEAGDSLFLVVEGAVRIHKDGRDLAVLTKGECLGEMALLDEAPRSADATAVDDCILMRIGQEDFIEVLSANPEIMQAMFRLLVRRLREANERISIVTEGGVK